MLNTDGLNKHPTECDVLIEAFATVFFTYKNETAPEWLLSAMKLCVRDEYGQNKEGSSLKLPEHYNGNPYDKDKTSAAAFLKWIRQSQQVDIVSRLHFQLASTEGYKLDVWQSSTGKTLDQLWAAYKLSGANYD